MTDFEIAYCASMVAASVLPDLMKEQKVTGPKLDTLEVVAKLSVSMVQSIHREIRNRKAGDK